VTNVAPCVLIERHTKITKKSQQFSVSKREPREGKMDNEILMAIVKALVAANQGALTQETLDEIVDLNNSERDETLTGFFTKPAFSPCKRQKIQS
jgi:hypothetical protein